MKNEIDQVLKFQKDEVVEVETRPSPEPVAEAVFESLMSTIPKFRSAIPSSKKEFQAVFQEIITNMLEINKSAQYKYNRGEIHSLIDKLW